jgi:hypothetical protein
MGKKVEIRYPDTAWHFFQVFRAWNVDKPIQIAILPLLRPIGGT